MSGDELLIPAVHAAADPVVRIAQQHGPLPAMHSQEFISAPGVVQIAVLLVAAESVILGEELLDTWLTDDYPGGRFHRTHLIPAHSELQRRRWPPTGDRDVWVRYGPTGPPADRMPGTAA